MRTAGTGRRSALLALFVLLAGACTQTSTLEVSKTTPTIVGGGNGPLVSGGPGGPAGGGGAVTGQPGSGPVASGPGVTQPDVQRPVEAPVQGPIKIGVMSTLSGGQKFVGEPPYRLSLAYAQRLNERGGINGRKLEVLGYDVCTNCPDEGLAQAKKAVENDHVFALANTFVVNASLDQVVPYLNDRSVPMLQGSSGTLSRKPELSPYNFSVGLTVPNRGAIDADYAKKYLLSKGLPLKVALLYFTDSLTSYIAENQRAALKRVGIQIVDEEAVTYDATMTNQSSQVVKMRAAGAEMVIGSHGVLCAFSMQSADQAKWQAPYLCTIMYDPFATTIAGHSALTNRDVFADTEGYATQDMKGPGVQDYLQLMRDYYPDGDIGLVTLYSYLGMRFIEEGVRSMGNNVTRYGLVKYMESLRNYDAGGLTAPFSLGPRDHGSITGAQIVKLNPDGSFKRMTNAWTYPDPIHHLPGAVQ